MGEDDLGNVSPTRGAGFEESEEEAERAPAVHEFVGRCYLDPRQGRADFGGVEEGLENPIQAVTPGDL